MQILFEKYITKTMNLFIKSDTKVIKFDDKEIG